MTGFRTLMDHLNEPMDRIASPRYAGELHFIVQMFTAFCAGFTVTALVMTEPRIGLTLCALGIACVIPAWLVATLGARMAIEVGLAVFAIHYQLALPPTQPIPSDDPSGKALER